MQLSGTDNSDEYVQLCKQIKAMGSGASLLNLQGAWPAYVLVTRRNSGRAKRPERNKFEIFLPMRSVTFRDLSGHRRTTYPYRRGMIGFTLPLERWWIEWDGVIEGAAFIIDPSTMRQAAADVFGEEWSDLTWRSVLGDHAPAIAYLGLDIVSQIATGYPAGRSHVDDLMRTFLSMLLRRYSSTVDRNTSLVGVSSHPVLRAVQYIESHLGDDLTRQEVCDKSAVSLPHLNRLFRAELGDSVWGYIQKRRLDVARVGLASTNQPITSVAVSCGFRTRANFTRCFRARFGMSPSDFRSAGDQ